MDVTTFSQPERCRLLELPAELRIAIYEHAFPPKTVHVWVDKNVYRWRSYIKKSAVALLATCRQIAAEATPVFHDNTTVHFSICDEFERLLSRYHRFGPLETFNTGSFNHVRKVHLSLHTLADPIYDLLLHHIRGLLARLSFCADIRSIEVHFEFWTNISDANLFAIYDTLSAIQFSRPVEIGTPAAGSWTVLYQTKCFTSCLRQIRDDVHAKREGLPLWMQNDNVGGFVGPRDLIISSNLR